MKRREEWRPVLDEELKRWSSMPLDRLVDDSREPRIYEVSNGSKNYQVEVEILEDTASYIHLSVSVDDGTLPHSIFPLCETLLRYKAPIP
jgi:hypothetical protein